MMETEKEKSKGLLLFFLALMGAMIILGILFYRELRAFLDRPALYPHVLFAHILTVTLFFANAVIGMVWEFRSLSDGRKEIIYHTYDTVTWLDARFSSPLIILSVMTGVLLTLMLGDIWTIPWLAAAFILFMLSGAIWVIGDIPTQYRIKSLLREVDPRAVDLPPELMGLLKRRLWISLGGVIPLVVVFLLMVYKPGF